MPAVPFQLYLITDEQTARAPDRIARALGAVPPGFAAVQLRAKRLDARDLLDAARALRTITRAASALLFVNERVDVALAAGADGVHLPARALPPSAVRAIAPTLRIGASTHTIDEARAAIEDGADFITIGPVWPTPSKPDLVEPFGLDRLAEAARLLPAPVFALGGVDDPDRAAACARRGARVACLRAVLGAADPEAAARAFTAAIHDAKTRKT